MSTYDLSCSAEQLKAAAAWATAGDDMAAVELLADDRMLLVSQGDDRAAFDTGGEPASEEYLAVAPLDRDGAAVITEETADHVWRGDGGPVLLVCTCSSHPEQYNAFTADGRKVGYLRLAGGHFTAQIGGPGGPVVYQARPEGDDIFADEERRHYLDEACGSIALGLQVAKALMDAREALTAEPDDVECGLQDEG